MLGEVEAIGSPIVQVRKRPLEGLSILPRASQLVVSVNRS